MREIKAQELSLAKFQKYGDYQNLLDNSTLAKKSIFPAGFFADVIKLDFSNTTLTTISVCSIKKEKENIISLIEAHQYTCEGLLPLDDDIIIFVGVPLPGEKFNVDQLEAFYVPKGTFVRINPYVLHGTQFSVSSDNAHVVCMLPGRTFMNDMIAERLPEDKRAVVVL